MNKEEFEVLINDLREKLDETQRALVSEEFLNIKSAFNNLYDDNSKNKDSIDKLNQEKQELLITNGKLFQKIGIEKEDKKIESSDDFEESKTDEEIIGELINEKGDII